MSWNEYIAMMLAQIKAANEAVLAAGGDGGLYEEVLHGYSG